MLFQALGLQEALGGGFLWVYFWRNRVRPDWHDSLWFRLAWGQGPQKARGGPGDRDPQFYWLSSEHQKEALLGGGERAMLLCRAVL